MKQHLRRSKTPSRLSPSSQRRLSYALAATAAGVGALALATPSEAEIVYTPTNVRIPHRLKLDLNNDGIADFELMNTSFGNGGAQLVAPVVHGNKVVGFGSYASALVPGVTLGSGGPFAATRASARGGTPETAISDSSSSSTERFTLAGRVSVSTPTACC
jgi:hypothetical protein